MPRPATPASEEAADPARPVALVSMPWSLLTAPSIQIGTLEALLRRERIPCSAHSFHLEWVAFNAPQGGFDAADYAEVADRWATAGAGEWVFAVPPARAASRAKDERYKTFLRRRGAPGAFVKKLERLRQRVPAFLDRCADELLAGDPAVVGFTTTYAQTLASVALATRLKERAPELVIVFGGAACEGEMGPALLEAFACIDVVVRGEGELVTPPLMRALAAGAPVPPLAGVCHRDGARIVEAPWEGPSPEPMDTLPTPVYDEYFERLARTGLAGALRPELAFESARGCWWGAKQHCTFCGLNGGSMKFRAKSPERVYEELTALARRHEVLDFTAVDNIIDLGYFQTLLPKLVEAGHDLSIFYETKANLSREQVRLLRDAGVRTIQPGIESLSTPILALMKKGVTALQNVRLLKWCSQYGIRVVWNLLHGFPGEDPAEYAAMAALVPSLVHLPAPRLGALVIDRFSPYHARPAEFGLELAGPLPYYEALFDAEEPLLSRLAYSFEARHLDGADSARYVGPLGEAIERWNRDADKNRGALSYRRGPGFLVVTDRRTTLPPAQYTLAEVESAIYLACDAGATVRGVRRALADAGLADPGEQRVREVLGDMLEARLVFEERGRYLSLAVGASDPPGPRPAPARGDAVAAGAV